MLGNSEKTDQWIVGFVLFNLLVFFYVHLFFYEQWISTMFSIIVPLVVWQFLIFGILAPDEVFMDLFGGFDNGIHNSQEAASPVPSVRAVLVSSGDF